MPADSVPVCGTPTPLKIRAYSGENVRRLTRFPTMPPPADLLLEVDDSIPTPLYVQVKKRLEVALDRGDFDASARLPSVRAIARAAGVTLRTAGQAIELLQQEGRVVTHVGRGVFLNPERQQSHKGGNSTACAIDLCIHPHFLSHHRGRGFQKLGGILKAAVARGAEVHPVISAGEVDFRELPRPGRGVLFFDHNYLADGFGAVSEFVARRGLPCCVADQDGGPHPFVRANRPKAFRLATESLLALGHRRVGFINLLPEPKGSAPENRAGYAEALRRAGIEWADELYVEAPHPEACPEGRRESPTDEALAGLLALPSPPTALLCNNDIRALLVMDLLKRRGLNVPGDISVMGCDDYREGRAASPALSTVDTKCAERGEKALTYVLRRSRGEEPPAPEVVPEVRPRASTGAPKARVGAIEV